LNGIIPEFSFKGLIVVDSLQINSLLKMAYFLLFALVYWVIILRAEVFCFEAYATFHPSKEY
jgi:hypothetical protein